MVIFQFGLRHWAKSWAYLGIKLPKYGAIIVLTTGEQSPLARGGDYSRKLSDGDLELIEMLKTTQGSIQLREIYTTLEDVGDIAGGISMSTISQAVKSRLLSGKKYT